MVTYKSYNTGILYVAESVYGTPVTVTTALQGKVKSHNSEFGNNLLVEQGLGEGRNHTFTGFGPFDVSGSMEWLVGRWDFFTHLIGPKTGNGAAATPFLLTESDQIASAAIPSFTMQVGSNESTDMVDTFAGCVLNSATISIQEGGIVTATADWVAKTFATNTAIVAYTADTTDLWVYQQGFVKWGATPSTLAGVVSGSVTISNNLFIYRSIGSRLIEQPEPGLRRYDFTITLRITDAALTTIHQDFLGQANSPHLGLTASEPTGSLEMHLYFEGPTNQKAWIQLDECFLNSMTKNVVVGDGIREVTFNGVAQKGLGGVPIKWQISA